jgi:hypothetical protein
LFFALAVGWLILRRTALTMDERHTLLIAQAIAGGDSVSFYVGSVTRYEGGSWLIAWPVALLLKLGAYGTAATSWTAASIAIGAVAAGSIWTGRHAGPVAALLLGPVCAAAFPEVMHYSYRAWGSLCEALVMLPVLALVHERWERGGRRTGGGILLGVLGAVAWVLSYFHFVTALAFVAAEAMQSRASGRTSRSTVGGVALVGGVAAVVFLGWVFLANPHPGEAWVVRDGRSLLSTVRDLLLPRIDLVLLSLPGAVMGELTEATPLRWFASAGILAASVGGAVRVWRRGGPLRRVVVFGALYLPALGVGHALLDPPEVYRYYLPLLASMAACIAAGGLRTALPAVVLGAAFWLPSGLAMPYQNPAYTVLELGSNAMHRYAEDPHVKFRLLRPLIPEWHRRWFAFGYGMDSGRRCSPTRAGGQALIAVRPEAAGTAPVALASASAWTSAWRGVDAPREEADFYFGLGVGFAADGRLDKWESEVMDLISESLREEVLLGLGASVTRSLEQDGSAVGTAVGGGLLRGMLPVDIETLGRGMALAMSAGRPEGAGLGLTGVSSDALERGLRAGVDRARRAMLRVPTIPTPHPPPEDL